MQPPPATPTSTTTPEARKCSPPRIWNPCRVTLADKELYIAYQQGNYYVVCTWDLFIGAPFFAYGRCAHGLDNIDRCEHCVRGATLTMIQYCRAAVAAQAVSESCCVR
ncbi:unnamed protein product [Linum trigynum]|uniref:Gnk2-homologous domain-containing protein n=1 Tax=Linum trigynum TaxID=586398 RepID=A0AAV2E3G8_9ROSI